MELKQKLSDLRIGVTSLMKAIGYSEETLKDYRRIWLQLEKYMLDTNAASLDYGIADAFIKNKYGPIPYHKLTENRKKKVYYVKALVHYQETGLFLRRHSTKEIEFLGDTGVPFNDYMQEIADLNRSAYTIKRYRWYINHLYRDLIEHDQNMSQITIPYLMQFLSRLDMVKPPITRNHIISVVRVFIKYLCSKNHLRVNGEEYWMPVLKPRSVSQPKLPSVYSADEVERLIKCVDRANPRGKRDYAMILLAARYGLRALDIISMRHCNLDWANNKIVFFQQKTGKKMELPLSEEVGHAIIDYLKFGRPDVSEPYIFITAQAPYGKITNVTTITDAVSKNMIRAGISVYGRKHGGHCLRHSLATNLLALKEPMPVISQVLGHSKTTSTMFYLRVDFQQLMQCALEVPCVPSTFYENLYE